MTSAHRVRQIQPRLLFEAAVDEIRRALYSGVYQPNDRINEVELARSLNLSRGPVREAIRRLEQDGVVVSEPQKGVRVANLTQQDALDALAIREHLETLSCARIAAEVSEDHLVLLGEIIDEMRTAEEDRDLFATIDLDYQFHRTYMEIASSTTAKRVWQSIAEQNRMYQALSNKLWLEVGSVADSHVLITDALTSGDAGTLRQAVIAHIDESRALVEGRPPAGG